MVRAQVLLTERHYHYLKKLSRSGGESLSAIVRRCIDAAMAPEPGVRERALALLGAFHDREGRTDVSRNHDAYLAGNPTE
jgi:hypothetical protein